MKSEEILVILHLYITPLLYSMFRMQEHIISNILF